MSQPSPETSVTSSQIGLVQNLFEEILQIQRENKATGATITRVKEIIQESANAVENSMLPNEMIVDAKILQAGSAFVNTNVNSLNTNLTAFSESKYAKGVLSYINKSSSEFPVGKEWKAVSPMTYKMFRRSHRLNFLVGAFAPEGIRKERAKSGRKRNKKGMEAEKKVVARLPVEKEQKEEESDVYDHILRYLVRMYKKNGRKPVCYFTLILDPDSYWRTIENIFHFAFLVRDGVVKMQMIDGLPAVEPLFKNTVGLASEDDVTHQFCFTLSVKDWQESIRTFQIRTPTIPPFERKT